MGCCASDLKGEKQADLVNDPAPQPIKKIATNFSTVDYDASATERRDTLVAPDEEARASASVRQETIQEEPGPQASSHAQKPPALATTSDVVGLGQLNPSLTEDPVTRNAAQGPVEPYRDVTASPVSPVEKNPLDTQLQQDSQGPSPIEPRRYEEKA